MFIRKEESGISIYYMALPRLHLMMATLIGGNTRMVKRKVMQHMSILMERDTLGNTYRISVMGMEYSDGQVDLYIKDKENKVIEKVMHITSGQMAMSIMDSGRMIICTEKESS